MNDFDIVICGGGISGLWLLNILSKAGFSTLLVEPTAVGGIQTIASQGMIHGGQKYMLGNNSSAHSYSIAKLPGRWDLCLSGHGDINLSDCRVLSNSQFMWPAGGSLSKMALNTSSFILQSKVKRLNTFEYPAALSKNEIYPVYELPEKVLDVSSLTEVLAKPYFSHVRMGEVSSVSRLGYLTVSGHNIKAQIIICAAGLGNEMFLSLLDPNHKQSQRRPLRQFMVKTMELPLFGHAITTSAKPLVTVTSHPLPSGGYIWYLGGSLAEDTLSFSSKDAIKFAKQEMNRIFKYHNWQQKEWAIWDGIRAEPYCINGRLPDGPSVIDFDNALVVWPTKLTLAPILGDKILSFLEKKSISPMKLKSKPHSVFSLDSPPYASFPWSSTQWIALDE